MPQHKVIPAGTEIVCGALHGIIEDKPIPVREAKKKGLTKTNRSHGMMYPIKVLIAESIEGRGMFKTYDGTVRYRHQSSIKIKQ